MLTPYRKQTLWQMCCSLIETSNCKNFFFITDLLILKWTLQQKNYFMRSFLIFVIVLIQHMLTKI